MGQYKKSTLTAAGERLVAQAIGGEIKLNITKVKTSNHQYPDGTNFKSLVDMDGIVQTMVGPKTAVYNDTLIQTRALFSNEEVKETYYIHNIGLYAMDGSEEVLFSISSATTPDEMPKYDGVAPTTCIYNIQNTISETSSVSLTINPAGYASIADIMELDEKKVDKTGDISETTINALDEPATDVQFPVPVAGESTKTFLGKVKKFFEDTKNWMTGVCLIGQIVNNCVTNNAKLPLSAAQGKVLMDLYTVLNTKITDFDSRIHIDDTTTIANLSAQIKTGFQCVYLKSANLKPNYGHGVILELNNASGLYAIRIISWDDDTPNIGMYYGIKLSPSTLIKDVSYFSLQVNR